MWRYWCSRAPSGPAAREIATRELRSEWSISKPARALRTLRRPSHRRRLPCCVHRPGPAGLAAASNRAGHVAVSGLALPPPARSPHASFARSGRSRSPPVPSGPSGARHAGGACRRPRALLPGLGGSLAGVNRAAIALPRPGLVPRETRVKRRGRAERTPGLDPTRLDPETLDDLRSRERRKDLARHKELRTTQTRADAAPARRARRIDEEPP